MEPQLPGFLAQGKAALKLSLRCGGEGSLPRFYGTANLYQSANSLRGRHLLDLIPAFLSAACMASCRLVSLTSLGELAASDSAPVIFST